MNIYIYKQNTGKQMKKKLLASQWQLHRQGIHRGLHVEKGNSAIHTLHSLSCQITVPFTEHNSALHYMMCW